MGSFNGNYSAGGDPRIVLDESKRVLGLLCQKDVPWSDIDDNLREMIFLSQIRRLSQLIGEGGEGDGWKPVGTALSNNFTFKGGGGTDDTALSFWLKGYRVALYEDVVFDNAGSNDKEKGIHSTSNSLTATVLADLKANYKVDELVGRELRPDITSVTSFTVISNTATTITTAGDMTTVAEAGDHYLIELSTPGSNRTDYIWMAISLDEISSSDDATILRTIEGNPVECKRQLKLIMYIHVREGDTDVLAPYTDGYGNKWYTYKLGELNRVSAQAVINSGEVIDKRNLLSSLNTGNVLVANYGWYQSLDDVFGDSSVPVGSEIVVFNQDDSGALNILSPNRAGLTLCVDRFFVSIDQNSSIVHICGNGNRGISGLRSILINQEITLESLYVDDTDILAPYGIRFIGANDIELTLRNMLIFSGSDMDEIGGFTGTVILDIENSYMNGNITIGALNTTGPHYFKDSNFTGTVSLTASSSVTVSVERCTFESIPTLANVILDLKNCWVGNTFYSYAKINNTGLHSASTNIAVVTTTQRNAIVSPVSGMVLLNSTRDHLQSRNAGGLWLDCLGRDVFKFYYYNVPINLTNQPTFFETALNEVLYHFKGAIVGMGLQVTSSRSGGSLVGRPSINGSPIGTALLDVTIDGSNPNDSYAVVKPGQDANLLFNAGSKLGIVITTDGTWAPTTVNLIGTISVVTRGD